ncbi:hypothetical protein [Thalassovita sp.]|uniref:hypothetical protein n=1 Tax=Thalassovita sp. TaxID=1979401 RepID=UPI003B5BA63A
MYEATANARTKKALDKAHAERGAALRLLVKALFRTRGQTRNIPLSAALTGSPR